jgi:hypothetical protein
MQLLQQQRQLRHASSLSILCIPCCCIQYLPVVYNERIKISTFETIIGKNLKFCTDQRHTHSVSVSSPFWCRENILSGKIGSESTNEASWKRFGSIGSEFRVNTLHKFVKVLPFFSDPFVTFHNFFTMPPYSVKIRRIDHAYQWAQ